MPRRKKSLPYRHPRRSDFDHLPPITITIDGEQEVFPDYPAIAFAYAEGVVTGRVMACRYVRLACQRYLDFLKRAERQGNDFCFSTEHVLDVCSFIEKLPHAEGEWDSDTIVLEPWQIWVLASIYGFIRQNGTRLVRWVLIVVPRKHGKSALTAGLSLYTLTCSGENSPGIFIGAPTLEQAGKVFDPAKKMVMKDRDLQEAFGLRPRVRNIYSDATLGSIQVITSVGEHQDGHNPSMVVLDELHAQNRDLYEVMRSAFGARRNPLMFQITTAGRVAGGICWEQQKRLIRVLEGREKADEVFGVVYTIDDEDLASCYDERVMVKAMPMWGVSIDPTMMYDEANEARHNPQTRSSFLRTRLNVWSNASERLIQPDEWDKCFDQKLRLEQFRGRKAYIGVDLASRRDMAAKVVLIEDGDDLVVFPSFYIPKDCVSLVHPDVGALYRAWIEDGAVFATEPGMIDFDAIEDDIREDCRFFDVKAAIFDPYQASQMITSLAKAGLPAMALQNSVKNMSEPTKDFVARVQTGLLRHDGNPVMSWHVGNVVGIEDNKGNIFPKKDAPNSIYKIDGVHALIFANCAMIEQREPEKKKRLDVYSVRGFHGAEDQT